MQTFDTQNPPFDRLTHDEIETVRAALDIGYFPPGDTIIAPGDRSDCLHVVVKGLVEERDGETVEARLGPKDAFDSRSLVHGPAATAFVAAEETLCWLLPKPVVFDLIARNPGFAAFFYSEISRKLRSWDRHDRDGVDSVLRARIRDVRTHPAVFIEGSASIEEAGRLMHERSSDTLYVHEPDPSGDPARDRLGILSGTSLVKAVVLEKMPFTTPVREVCHFDVVAISPDDFVFAAVIAMTRHSKRRLAIRESDTYVGVLEDIDILGLVAGNPQLVPGRIDQARAVDDLAPCARDIQAQVERLHRQGARVEVIAEITSDLNRRLFAKLFELIAPSSIRGAGCLMVMGSEGRGEQTVRTDQDNGLLLAHPVPEEDLDAFRADFTAALESFGFPPCPGDVMVKNPRWSQPIDAFVAQIRDWVMAPGEDGPMNLGIFFDAVPVTGHHALLDRAKTALIAMMTGESAYLSRFARAIDQFEGASAGVLTSIMASVGVGSDEIDVKKAGTFPIVHGVRTLAIDTGVREVSTVRRIGALVEAGLIGSDLGRELPSALSYFMELRLRSQLAAIGTGKRERESIVRLGELTSRDRDLLRDALRVVKRFREIVRNRYHLGVY
ncbi:Putative signal-transduction protein [Rhodovulum sp. PH10]|uniref:DUF294 nucleotidyltransferase-like domain-containing protein n=1 Tax=Rhodovulum sp. PH10 TaxID=1187851 RepID=UPI00027C2978|nr:DUF294 nucleotidyltransferase-like domain-containing protein [Rhodovulum sp. PH10]EJW10143.1 Putative signal-transduction protein [Rhodovulum sp. PH10]